MDYTIISNSCTGELVYNEFFTQKHPAFIEYTTPFVSTWFPNDEQYVKFCQNYDHYISIKPHFGMPKHKRIYHSKIFYYPVMFLDDIEIHWAHDRTDDEAHAEKMVLIKYHERLKLSKTKEPIFLWACYEMYNDHSNEEKIKLIQNFNNIKRKTIYLTNVRKEEYYDENTIVKFIPEWEEMSKSEYGSITRTPTTPRLFKDIISQIL